MVQSDFLQLCKIIQIFSLFFFTTSSSYCDHPKTFYNFGEILLVF